MEQLVCYCSICGGTLLGAESFHTDRSFTTLIADELYCPHCEMLVRPITAPVCVLDPNKPPVFDMPPENPGRTAVGGSNAGGSQRGDLSDQGGTQWVRDPHPHKL